LQIFIIMSEGNVHIPAPSLTFHQLVQAEFQKELKKLEDIFNSGFIGEDEYATRKRQIYELHGVPFQSTNLQHDLIKELKISKEETTPNIGKSPIIVCFMVDGTDKYMDMTLKAITSFQKTTPSISVGILIQNGFEIQDFLNKLPNPNVYIRYMNFHFTWNPTQHKLDIAEFFDEFETVFWLDSDVIVFRDLTPHLVEFHHSSYEYAFVRDRVNDYDEFKRLWTRTANYYFVPQACIMGFKKSSYQNIFASWEKYWKEWITPHTFAKYQDPYPSFYNSWFCVEQYALGMAIETHVPDYKQFATEVLVIPRYDIFVKGEAPTLDAIAQTASLSPEKHVTITGKEVAVKEQATAGVTSSYVTSSGSAGDTVLDNFWGCLIHYYSVNWEKLKP